MSLFGALTMNEGYDEASDQYDDSYNQVSQELSPYTDPAAQDFGAFRKAAYGGEASLLPARRGLVGELSQNPIEGIGAIESSYKMSPSAKYDLQKDLRAQQYSAAAGGYVGAPQDQLQMEKLTQGIVSEDQQQYLENVLKLGGMQGREFNSLQNNLMRMMSDIINKEYGGTNQLVRSQEQEARQQAALDISKGRTGASELMGLGQDVSNVTHAIF